MAAQGRVMYYVDGNTVRREVREQGPQERSDSKIRENRERALQMNMGYIIFLTAAAVLTVLICVNYLRLQASFTAIQRETLRLESNLSTMKLENDTEYNRIMAGVNLEHVRNRAMKQLGMVYASEEQVVTYEAPAGDYVKQYSDIPDLQ